MTQLEYDIVKGLWGRPRAVNELLGLRVMRRRAETTPQREAVFAASAFESITAPVPGLTPASGLYSLERAAGRVPAVTPTSDVIAAAAETAPGGRPGAGMSAGRRFLGTFAAQLQVSVTVRGNPVQPCGRVDMTPTAHCPATVLTCAP